MTVTVRTFLVEKAIPAGYSISATADGLFFITAPGQDIVAAVERHLAAHGSPAQPDAHLTVERDRQRRHEAARRRALKRGAA